MSVIVRYVAKGYEDGFLNYNGNWRKEKELAYSFASERDAKKFMIENNFDIPANQTIFETVESV